MDLPRSKSDNGNLAIHGHVFDLHQVVTNEDDDVDTFLDILEAREETESSSDNSGVHGRGRKAVLRLGRTVSARSPKNRHRASSDQQFNRRSNMHRASASSLMRKQENRLTRISLSIVSLFVACHVWRLIPTAFEAVRHFSEAEGETVLSQWPPWLIHVNHISHTLIVFNSAVNFLLYIIW